MAEKEDTLDYLEMQAKFFEDVKLCPRAQALYWELMIDYAVCGYSMGEAFVGDYGDCYEIPTSPVEQIFQMAWYCFFARTANVTYAEMDKKHTEEDKSWIRICSKCGAFVCALKPQVKFTKDKKNYIVDFVLDFTETTSNKWMTPYQKLKYVIEIDGFEYHSSKKQVNYDYKREQELQMAGYKVVRFTGSQVYNSPYECVNTLVNIVEQDKEKEHKENE